jgi:5'-phosphate synthase pdxT subunit
VLALQGGVAEHARMVEGLEARAVLVRRTEQLAGPDGPRVDALILPGGESSAMDRLLRLLDLFEPLRATIRAGVPTLGTCAGLILLARAIHDPAPDQRSLGSLDVAVARNAFGPQLVSTEASFSVDGVAGGGPDGRVRGALIRAPEVREVGPAARVIARAGDRILGVTSVSSGEAEAYAPTGVSEGIGRVTGVSFHPELSGDPALHRALIARATS